MAEVSITRFTHGIIPVVVILVVLASMSAPITLVAAQEDVSIRGEPDLSVRSASPTLAPGQATTLSVQVSNDGDLRWGSPDQREAVVTARDVTLEAQAEDAPFEVESSVISLGSVGEQRPKDVEIAVTVPDNAESGTYDLDVEIDYSHVAQYWTSGTTQYAQEHSHTIEETIEIDVEETARFEVSNVTTDAQIGNDGRLNATIENVGTEPAEDVRLVLESSGSSIAFDGSTRDETYVGSLEAGESTLVSTDIDVAPDANARTHSIDGSVTYVDPDGFDRVDSDLILGVNPKPEQTLSIVNTSGSLRAGEERPLSITVRNDGPRTVDDPVASVGFENQHISLHAPQQAIGTLDPNETATVEYDVDVAPVLQESSQEATVTVAYSDAEDDRRASDAMTITPNIAPQRDHFSIENSSGSLRAGEERQYAITLRNDAERAVTDPVVSLAFDNPNIYLDSPQQAIGRLGPNETTTVTYDVDVSAAVQESRQGATVTVAYTDADGDRLQSTPVQTTARIEPERDRFEVNVVKGTVTAGSTGTIELNVTNRGDRPVSEIEAKAYLNDPLESSDDEGMIRSLDPGESTTISFDVQAASGAPAKTYALSADFHYERHDGDAELSRTYAVPVDVEPQPERDVPIVVIGVALVVLIGAVMAFWQRDRLRTILD